MMTDILFQVIQMILSMVEVWLCYQLLYSTLLEKEYLNRKEKAVIWVNILLFGAAVSYNRNIIFFSHSVFLLGLFVTSICAIAIFKSRKLLTVSLVVTGYSLIALLDFFFMFLSMMFLDYPTAQDIYHGISWIKVPIFLVSRLTIMGWFFLLKKKGRLFLKNISEYQTILYASSIIFIILLRRYQYIMCDMVFGRIPYDGINSGISLLSLLLIILFGLGLYIKSLLLKKENQLLASKDAMMLQNYRDLMRNMEANKQKLHDLKHQFLALQGYVQEKEYEKLGQYLSEINESILGLENKIWTGHKILDFILNQKKEIAEKKGIDFDICVTALMEIPLSDGNLSVLAGNLLDNAIEACDKIETGKRWILFRLRKRRDMLLIEISNSIGEQPKIKNGELLTSKKHPWMHGYGLKSVRRIVEKNEGVFSFSIEENVFKIQVAFMK